MELFSRSSGKLLCLRQIKKYAAHTCHHSIYKWPLVWSSCESPSTKEFNGKISCSGVVQTWVWIATVPVISVTKLGEFRKFLATNFLTKFCNFSRLLIKTSLCKDISWCSLLGNFWGKLGNFLFQHMATLLVMKMEMKGNEKCPHLNAKLMAKPHRKSQTENRTRERAFISSFFDATLTTIRIGLTTTRIERTNERASGLRRRRRHRRRSGKLTFPIFFPLLLLLILLFFLSKKVKIVFGQSSWLSW